MKSSLEIERCAVVKPRQSAALSRPPGLRFKLLYDLLTCYLKRGPLHTHASMHAHMLYVFKSGRKRHADKEEEEEWWV